jgi:hypothetical protein
MSTTAPTRPPERTPADQATSWAARLGAALRRPYAVDIAVAVAFLAAAAWICAALWPDPATRTLALNPADQILIEWFLAVDTQILTGNTGLVTDRLNAPHGVNLLVNASGLLLGWMLAPVTLTLGAPVSFALLTAGSLAATAAAWYLLFARTLGAHRAVAAVGGAWCGFAPAMISQSNSHWHMTAQWLVPALVWSVVRLVRSAGDRRRAVTSGLWLGGLVTVQYFLGLEVLYLTALTLALFTIGYAAQRAAWARRVLPRFLLGLGVAVGTATALLAYPLWIQLSGPGSVPNGLFSPYYFSADLASWPAFSPLTLAGTPAQAELATGPAEYNTFLGWPLLLVTAGCVWWLAGSRPYRPAALSAAAAAVVMGVLALGPELVVNGTRYEIPLPYAPLVGVPVIDGALPQRYAVAVVPLVAVILVLALERARRLRGDAHAAVRRLVPVAVAAALLPLLPTPLPGEDRPPVPAFISGGHWRGCVPPGGTLVPVPLPTPTHPEPMRWATATNAAFAVPEGFFIGPHGPGGRAAMGIPKRPTSQLWVEVADTGERPVISALQRAHAANDLTYWGADCVVLAPTPDLDSVSEEQLHAVLVDLLGPGERVADAWIWRR